MKRIWIFTALAVLVTAALIFIGSVALAEEDTDSPGPALTGANPDAVAAGGIQSLSGSFVEFDPSVGGDVCFIPDMPQTFCFRAESFSPDWEYVYNLWQMFPADWTVTDVYVEGTPWCDNGSWGTFSWSFQTSPYEVNIYHPRYQGSGGAHCIAYYCFEVLPGTGEPEALESWYWDGDGYGSVPHNPCSDDQYTPAGQNTCDEWINPQAAVPPCELDPIMLTPQEIYDEGCPCEPQEHEFTVWNNTGYNTDVNLTYTLVQGDGTCQGPASVFLPDGANMEITVELYPQGEPGDIVECEIYAEDASQPENNDTSWIIKELFDGAFYWEQIAAEPDSGRMDNVLAGYDGLVWSITGYGLNANVRNYDPETNTWSTVAGSTAPFGNNYARSGCHPYGSEAANKVFVYGDSTTSGFTGLWSYDMDANVWTNETPGGTPPAQTGIWSPAWTYDPDDQLCYMTGGATAPGGGDLTTVYIYDPLANAWLDPLPNFSTNRAFHAAFMYDGMVCVMGGIDAGSVVSSSTQCYADGSWNAENADIPALPMGWWGMGYASKVHFGSDLQFWLVGGADAAFEIINNTYYYDVNVGTWEEGGPLASGSFYRTAATNLDGDLYHVGGSVGGFSYSGLSDHHVQIACEPCPVEECTWVELVVEDFEAWPPADWTIIDYGGTCVWESSQTTGRTNYAGGDGYAADADSDWCGSGSTMDTGLQTPHFNLSHALEARLEYVASYNYLYGSEFAAVNFNQSGDWTTLLFWQEDHDAYGPGEFVSLDLPVGDPDAFVEFHYYSPAWNWWYMVDQVVVSACVTEIPALEAWKEAPATAEPGETITYTIYIEAQQLIDGMYMVDPLPAGVEYAGNLEWTDGEAWYDADDNTVYWEYYETEAVGEPVSPSPAVYDPAAVADQVGGVEPSGVPLPEGDVKTFSYPLSVLWDNGPLVTHPGGGYGGADASRLQTTLGMNTLGFGHQFINGYRMADDFEITDPSGWWIDTITFFAYQTGAPIDPSTITGVYYQIWDGPPDDPGSSIVWGDLATNRLLDSAWSNIYRDSESNPNLDNRPIMASTASAGLFLPAGTYWLDWMSDGTLASGPWAPPITILGETTTGNALQYTTAWAPANDSGTLTQQGMPFIIEGEVGFEPVLVEISFDVLVTGEHGDLIVNEGWAGMFEGEEVTFEAVTEVVGTPGIAVDPLELWVELFTETTAVEDLNVCNAGTAPLEWEIHEQEASPLFITTTVSLPAGPQVAPGQTAVAAGPFQTRPESTYTVRGLAGVLSGPDVLLVNADDDNDFGSDIQVLLEAYGTLGSIDLFDARIDTPSLALLQEYDVVLTWSNYVYADPVGMGNVLADYVDVGGKVINLLFSMGNHGWHMQGRFMDEGYTAMNGTSLTFVDVCLGTYDADHPIMDGVTNVCEFFRVTDTYLTAGSYEVAQWADGLLFVAAKDDQTVVSINGYVGYHYQWTEQMPDVLHNAILWLADMEPVDIPWLSEDPVSGVVPVGECQVVEVTFDSTGMDLGDYFAELVILSNDPEEPQVVIPVTMSVIEMVYGVELLPVEDALSGDPGETVEYTLTLTNTGNVSDTFEVTFEGNLWDVHLPETSFILEPDESADVIVHVTVPADAMAGDFDVVTITATSAGDPELSAASVLTTTANAVYGLMLTTDEDALSGEPGETVEYTLTLTNTGNAADTFAITFAGNLWDVHLPEDEFMLDAGESVALLVHVTIADDALDGDFDEVTVTATSAGDENVSASVMLTTTAEVPAPEMFYLYTPLVVKN